MSNFNFTKELANRIIEYSQIPKLQVERIVGPVLSIFLESIMSELLTRNTEKQNIELILPEFPLKKEFSSQSSNIDWLLINRRNKIIYLVELKTDISSLNKEQLELYNQVKYKIKSKSALILLRDFKKIMQYSDKKIKYNFAFEKIKSFENELRDIYNLDIVYIVPFPLKEKLLYSVDHVFSFSDLPNILPIELNEDWIDIRNALLKLDTADKKEKKLVSIEKIDKNKYLQEIIILVKTKYPESKPYKIWLGKTGSGFRPNFQIEFEDGTIKPFYSNGNPYTRKNIFKFQNLDGPFEVQKIN